MIKGKCVIPEISSLCTVQKVHFKDGYERCDQVDWHMVTWDENGVEDAQSERLGAGDARSGWAGMTVGQLKELGSRGGKDCSGSEMTSWATHILRRA